MRVAVLADVHLGHRSHVRNENGLLAGAWHKATSQISEGGYDACVLAGDLFHTGRPLPEDLLICYEGIKRLTDSGCETVIVTGNHEWIGVNSIKAHRPPCLLMSELANVSVCIESQGLRVADMLWLSVLPWTAPGAHDPLCSQAEEAEMLADDASQEDGLKLMVGHAEVIEAMPFKASELEMCANVVSAGVSQASLDFPDGYGIGLLGHIHARTRLSDSLSYVGSLEAYTFADEGRAGAWISLEADSNSPYGWRAQHIECGLNKFATVTMDEDLGSLQPGTRVRIRLRDGESSLSFDETAITDAGLVFAGWKDERSQLDVTSESDAADDNNESWTTDMLVDKWVERERLSEREESLYRDAVASELGW